MMRSCLALALALLTVSGAPTTIQELVARYEYIFQTGNRNAASHLWSSYVLDRARELEPDTLELLFRGFCPISGSPLPDDPHTRFYSTLPSVSGGTSSGITHHCCWPCICDTQSTVKTDTKQIETAKGPRSYTFLVIGDPCVNQGKLKEAYQDPFTGHQVTLEQQAPEVTCVEGKLRGAHFSDHGYVIVGMYFVKEEDKKAAAFTDASDFTEQCEERKQHGFDSGMGAIFQKVAAINPIVVGAVAATAPALASPPSFVQKWGETQGSPELLEPASRGMRGADGAGAMSSITGGLIFAFGILGLFGLVFLLMSRRPKAVAGSDSDLE